MAEDKTGYKAGIFMPWVYQKLISNDQIADLNTIKVQLDGNEEFLGNGGLSYLLKLCENTVSIIIVLYNRLFPTISATPVQIKCMYLFYSQ